MLQLNKIIYGQCLTHCNFTKINKGGVERELSGSVGVGVGVGLVIEGFCF